MCEARGRPGSDAHLSRAAFKCPAFVASRACDERYARDCAEAERRMARRAARAELVAEAAHVDSELAYLLRDIVWQRKRDGLRGPSGGGGERFSEPRVARCVSSGPRVLLRELVAGLGPRQVVEERRAVQPGVVRSMHVRVFHVDDVASGYRGARLARRREVAF